MALCVSLLALSGCRGLRVERAAYTDAGDWLTEGSGGTRQSSPDVVLAPPLKREWIYNASAGFGQGSPLLLGNTVIVATRQGEVHAIDLKTGNRLGVKGFGDAIEGTPVISGGIVYVPVAWGGHSVYAHNLQKGSVDWVLKGPPVEAGLLLAGDVLLAVDVESRLHAIDPLRGSVRWDRSLDSSAAYLVAPVALDVETAAVANDRGSVTALNVASGAVEWEADAGAPVQDTPAVLDGRMYVPTTRGRLVALDAATGEERWTFALPDTTVYLASPAVGGGGVVFGASDGYVRALDAATGDVQWEVDLREGISAAPLLVQNTIYVGALDGTLYGLSRSDGRVVWKEELEGRIKSAPAARDGHLVVLSEPRYVYLFRPTQATYAQTH